MTAEDPIWKNRLGGVVGVLTSFEGARTAEFEAARAAGLSSVELRADLMLRDGADEDAVLTLLRSLRERGLATLFTLRLTSQGGVSDRPEADRERVFRAALESGADAVDCEWGTDCARNLAGAGFPVIVSHHDFAGMLDRSELERLAREAGELRPIGIKLVPTAARLVDSATLLDWVAGRPDGAPARIGFAMGAGGVPSRILALSRGAPLTYGSITSTVAPGQLSALELLETYAAHDLRPGCRTFGVVGERALGSFSPYLHNPALRRRSINAVYTPLEVPRFDELVEAIDRLDIDGVSVTIPFKEDARRFATSVDERSEASGATNTLVVRRDPGVERAGAIRGFNTDYDGVLLPLGRRLKSLRRVAVAVIGNGGAARGAVLALREAGASPTMFYRDPERGSPVAEELEVPGKPIEQLSSFRGRVIINATPLGRDPGDPSPAPASILTPRGSTRRIAFEMIYDPAQTAFLRAAEAAGAEPIAGREMLISQGVVQFTRFFGSRPTEDEFSANYDRGVALRQAQQHSATT